MSFSVSHFLLGLNVSNGLNTIGGTQDTVIIDFKNGVYTINGVGSTIGALTEQDAVNWNAYDPSDVVPGSGYPSLGEGPVLKGAAKAAVLAGATIVLDFVLVNDLMWFEIFDPSFTTDYKWSYQTFGSVAPRYVDAQSFTDWSHGPIDDNAHKVAFTQSFDSMSWSIDGQAVEALDAATAVPSPTIVGIYLDGGNAASFLRSIKIMPIQGDASLPALSAP